MRSRRIRPVPSHPLLSGCSLAERRRLSAVCVELDIAAGRQLCQQGERGREAFLILAGEAGVEVDGGTVTVVGAGEVVGELSLLDRQPRAASIVALTPLRALVFSLCEFRSAMDIAPSFAAAVEEVAGRHRAEIAAYAASQAQLPSLVSTG